MQTRDLTFTSGGHQLTGTLTTPATPGPHPAAVLVSGSGPIDRDSNMKRQRLGVMRDIAEHLARAGIASFRYDKRGVGASDGDYHATGFEDNVADAAAALEALRTEPGIGTIHVVGHSEGALIATRLAAADRVNGSVVLLGGTARSGADVLRYQASVAADALPAFARFVMKLFRVDLQKTQAKRLDQLAATTTDTVRIQLVKVNAKWFREFMAYDPGADLESITIPVLAITGGKDLQSPPDDLDIMQARAGGSIEVLRPSDLSHILRADPNTPTLQDYKRQMTQPVDGSVLEAIAGFIGQAGNEAPAANGDHTTSPMV